MARTEALIRAQNKYLLARKRVTLMLTPTEAERLKKLSEETHLTLRHLVMVLVDEYGESLKVDRFNEHPQSR